MSYQEKHRWGLIYHTAIKGNKRVKIFLVINETIIGNLIMWELVKKKKHLLY